MRKISYLFSKYPDQIRDQLEADPVALYSITECHTADAITSLLRNLPNVSIITDLTACVGGNTLSFATQFDTVHSIEIDETRYNMLLHNVAVFGYTNITCLHGDAVQCINTLQQDVIFIDPPWGGPSYDSKRNIKLFLNGIDLADIVLLLLKHTKFIAIKVPPHFALYEFHTKIKTNIKIHRQFKKMILIIIDGLI
jgi:16S rRNA G966 N2-methylase RsmD